MLTRVSLLSRLILIGVLLTSKMFNDTYYTNKYISEVGGVTLANINDLERYFMQVVDWHVNITTEEFELYEQGLQLFTAQVPSAQSSPIISTV